MLSTLFISLNQICMMFIFMVIGYIFRKKNLAGEHVDTVTSSLLVNVFMPALCFETFSNNFSVETLMQNSTYLIAGIGVLTLMFICSKFLAKVFAENKMQDGVYMYSFLIPNLGYMGYPLIEAVFGEQALFNMMIFVIPFNITIYTYGIYILHPDRKWDLKRIINPSIIAILLGMICGVMSVKIPHLITNALDSAKACMSPTAMILAGFVLADVPIKSVILNAKAYIAAIVRAIVLPGITFLILYLLKVDTMLVVIATATMAMPMGLNSIVFPAAFGGDSMTGARACFISNVLSIITIPLVFAFLSSFVH